MPDQNNNDNNITPIITTVPATEPQIITPESQLINLNLSKIRRPDQPTQIIKNSSDISSSSTVEEKK
jgi:hypothetical protein